MSLLQTFEDLIDPDWRLERKGGEWVVSEPGSEHSSLWISGTRSFAFSLDHKTEDRFPFMRENTPLAGMRSTCDAIVIATNRDETMVVAVEMKTKESDKAKALKQIESGRLLVEWLCDLLRFHGHWHGTYRFCGIISLKPRRQERKGTTSRRTAPVLPPAETSRNSDPVYVLKNHPRLNLADLAKSIGVGA